MIYRVELRDRDLEFAKILDNRVFKISWSYDAVGGCSGFSFSADTKYCTELDFGSNFNVQIKRRNPDTKNYDLWYQGRIETVTNSILGTGEKINISGFGYQSELQDVIVNESYTSQEISVIVKDVLDTYVVPNTNITYDSADIEATGFTPDSLDFSYVSTQEIFKKLADITGGIEWGVDKDRKFFFKAQSNQTGFFFPLGKQIESFNLRSSSREIINRVIVIGGEVDDNKFVYTKDYVKNQAKYKRRDKVISNSAVTTNSVAEQLADAQQALGDGVVDTGSMKLNREVLIEDVVPIPLFKLLTREVTYDEKLYDTFLYAEPDPFRINKVKYSIDENSRLSIVLSVGENPPTIVESIKQLKFNIDQETQAR